MQEKAKDIYRDNEELELLVSYGKKDTEAYLEKGTIVNFVKSFDGGSIDSSKILAKVPNTKRAIIVKETDVKPVEEKVVEVAFQDFNKMMMETNPELRIYHPNFFVRTYFKIYYFFKKRFSNE